MHKCSSSLWWTILHIDDDLATAKSELRSILQCLAAPKDLERLTVLVTKLFQCCNQGNLLLQVPVAALGRQCSQHQPERAAQHLAGPGSTRGPGQLAAACGCCPGCAATGLCGQRGLSAICAHADDG